MLTYPNIDPVALSLGSFSLAGKTIGPINIHWYGLAYLCGFALGWFLAHRRCNRRLSVVKSAQLEDVVFYSAMGVVLGGRIGYVLFYNFGSFLQDPIMIFKVWEGGMSFHGGMIGFALAMLLYGIRHQRHFLDMIDFVSLYAVPGLLFGRLANFIGSELYGRATDVSWAMIFPKDPTGLPRHPSQLYEAFLEGIVLFAILWWFSLKPRPRGAVCGLFGLLYGCFRFFVEFFREPDAHISYDMLGWVTRGQELCIPMIVIGAGLLYWAYKKPMPIFEEQEAAALKKIK